MAQRASAARAAWADRQPLRRPTGAHRVRRQGVALSRTRRISHGRTSATAGSTPRRLRQRARRARAQPAERRCRYSARRAGGVHRCLGLGQVLARLRHPVRRGAAPVFRIGRALRAAADRPGGRAPGRPDRRPAAGRGPAAAARHAHRALLGRQRHHHRQPGAHAVLPRRPLPAEPADAVRRGFLAQHRRGRLPRMPRPGPHLRGDRAIDGARPHAHHPRARRRRLAHRLAGPEPARHPHHPGPRRRPALARFAEEDPRLDPLHRRAAHRAGVCRLRPCRGARRRQGEDGAELHGHLHRRAALRAADLRHQPERADEETGVAVHGRHRLPGVRGQAPEARRAVGHFLRPRHRCAAADAARRTGRGAAARRRRPLRRREGGR